MRGSLLVGALLLAPAGCSSVALVDDVDVHLDNHALSGPSDSLHTPYVQGASMRVYVESSSSKEDMSKWTLETSDAAIFAINMSSHGTNGRLSADCTAAHAGRATLTVRDGDHDVQHRVTVEVKLPARIDLMAHGLLMVGRSTADATVSELRIRRGGTATFLIRYTSGGQELFGNGALTVDAPTGIDALPRRTFFSEDRDWLAITPLAGSTSAALTLRAGGTRVADVPVSVVADSDVTGLRILGEDETRAKDGQWLWALAQGYDDAGRLIFGVDYSWDVDGQSALGSTGDVYGYQFDARKPRMLAANFNGIAAVARIHGGTGFVSSSNFIGCSTAPGRSPSSGGGLLLVAGLLVAARRRSRSRA